MLTRLPMCSQIEILPLEAAPCKRCSLFRRNSKKCLEECAVPDFHHMSCQGLHRPTLLCGVLLSLMSLEKVLVYVSLQVPSRRHPLPRSVLVRTVHPIVPVRGLSGARVGAWRYFDDCVFDFRAIPHGVFDVLQQLHLTWFVPSRSDHECRGSAHLVRS